MKKNIFLFVILFFLTSINISAQLPGSEKGEALQEESAKDKALTMEMQDISETQPGTSDDPADNNISIEKENDSGRMALVYWMMGSAIVFLFLIVHYVEVLPFLHKRGKAGIASWLPAIRYFKDTKLYADLCKKEGKPLNWYSLDVKAQTLLFLWAIAGILLYFVFNIDITAIF